MTKEITFSHQTDDLIKARMAYHSYIKNVNSIVNPEWEQKLINGQFDRYLGVQVALIALAMSNDR